MQRSAEIQRSETFMFTAQSWSSRLIYLDRAELELCAPAMIGHAFLIASIRLITSCNRRWFLVCIRMPLWIAVVLLGIIEGITEFLPVSSTGHLLIAERWLPKQTDLFNVVIQCGAVLAVLPLFPARIHQFLYRWRDPRVRAYLLKICVAFVITGLGGLVMEKKHFKLPENIMPVAIALLVGGVLFVVVEGWLRGRALSDHVTWGVVLAVGIGQLIAAGFPGSSRSGVTILFSLMLGLNRVAATEFSFLVGIPTMLAAGGLKIFKAITLHGVPSQENWSMIALAFIVASVVSFCVVKWLLRFIQTHTFVSFGWYRILLAVLLLILLGR
jgi:undecaprenyl-diphosphatase